MNNWYNTPENQLKLAKKLNKERKWGFKDFPEIPNFTPQTDTEVLLLSICLPSKGNKSGIARTFDELWDAIEAPQDWTKYRWDELTSDKIRLVNNRKHTPGLKWVAIDMFANWDKENGRKVEDLWEEPNNLAASEALSALLLFPEFTNNVDGAKIPYIDLAGYQYKYNASWSDCPYFSRWVDVRQLGLYAGWADDRNRDYSAPRVRELDSGNLGSGLELGTRESEDYLQGKQDIIQQIKDFLDTL